MSQDENKCTCSPKLSYQHRCDMSERQGKEMEAAAEKYAIETWSDTPMSGKPKNEYLYRLSSKALAKSAYIAGWKAASERKDAEIARLSAIVVRSNHHLEEVERSLYIQLDESDGKLAMAAEALEFYAEESNWEIDHDDCGNGYVREGSDYRPPGTRARGALAVIKGDAK